MLDTFEHLALHERGKPRRQPQQQPVHGARSVAARGGVDGVYSRGLTHNHISMSARPSCGSSVT